MEYSPDDYFIVRRARRDENKTYEQIANEQAKKTMDLGLEIGALRGKIENLEFQVRALKCSLKEARRESTLKALTEENK